MGKIPDSLKTAFKTKNGRTVYDGGGIEPDIKIGDGTSSGFPPRQVGVIYQYYGTISDSILSLPVGWNDMFNFRKK